MNKAFVREQESTAEYCPRCGTKGEVVGGETIRHHLPPGSSLRLAEPASFCPSPACAVVYFDGLERTIELKELAAPVYPKDPDAPLCACFGLTRDDVEEDIAEGVTTRVKAILERARSPEAHCAQAAANGRSCVAYVQKYYMHCLQARKHS
jgi:hypothetical protein